MDAMSPVHVPMTALGMDLSAVASMARSSDGRAIDTVAQGFESMFVSLLVKQMRQTLEPGTLFSQDPGDVLGGLFDHFLGQHLAQQGALGIGALVRKQWSQGAQA